MKIFQFSDYRHFIRAQINSDLEPVKGTLTEIAKAIKTTRPYLSQVMGGSKNFSREQAFLLSQFFKLDRQETQYLYELINLSRASSQSYKNSILAELKRIKDEVNELNGELKDDQVLDQVHHAIFYSNWTYSAIHLLCGFPHGRTDSQISAHLKIPIKTVKANLIFLVNSGLCVTDGNKYYSGKRRTHLDTNSVFNNRYQANWRLKALEHLANAQAEDLFFTASVRIDEKAYLEIRAKLKDLISEFKLTIDESGDTTLACLNLDWFQI